jgi:parvulin-like peptidyl-prolyl isomerase
MSWLREPLVHFLLIGFLFFVGYGLFHRGMSGPVSHRIELTPTDVNQLQMYFVSQWHRQPTPQELAALIEDRVRDEVLYREALGMGLDKDDTIVKRRMAQKMEFLADDIGKAHQPSDAELRSWYRRNAQRFASASVVNFRQVYFSPDIRGAQAGADAAEALKKLRGQPENSKSAASISDHSLLPQNYRDSSLDQLTKDFGLPFATAVFKLKAGSWQGPVLSGFGWHLVFLESIQPGHAPLYEEIEPDVKAAWFTEQRTEVWHKTYAEMRSKYQVLLPSGVAVDPSRMATAPSEKPINRPSEGIK